MGREHRGTDGTRAHSSWKDLSGSYRFLASHQPESCRVNMLKMPQSLSNMFTVPGMLPGAKPPTRSSSDAHSFGDQGESLPI